MMLAAVLVGVLREFYGYQPASGARSSCFPC